MKTTSKKKMTLKLNTTSKWRRPQKWKLPQKWKHTNLLSKFFKLFTCLSPPRVHLRRNSYARCLIQPCCACYPWALLEQNKLSLCSRSQMTSMQTNNFETLLNNILTLLIHSCNTYETLVKHLWNIGETLVKHWWNTSETLVKHW